MVSANPASRSEPAVGEVAAAFPSWRGGERLASRSRIPDFARYTYSRTLGFLKSLIARIDVLNFPGSCCG